MGLISFIKGAGEKIFGKSEATLESEKAAAIVNHLKCYGFHTEILHISVDNDVVTITGMVDTLADKNKIVVAAGNVNGISAVNDQMTVLESPKVAVPVVEPAKQFYTVVSGDNLSRIAKNYYGNPNKYPVIFEANKPMLKSPDLIYPGQVLVIPPVEG